MNVPLRFSTIAKGASRPVSLDPNSDYLFLVTTNAAAAAVLASTLRGRGRYAEICGTQAFSPGFERTLFDTLVAAAVRAIRVSLSPRLYSHAIVFARLPTSTRTVPSAVAAYLSLAGPAVIPGR